MGDDGLERAAQRHRAKVANTKAREQAARDEERPPERRDRYDALAGFAGKPFAYISTVLALLALIAGGVVLAVRLPIDGLPAFGVYMVMGAVIIVALIAMMSWSIIVLGALRGRALRRVRGIDCDAYLGQLVELWIKPVAHVRVQFAEPWPEARRQTAIDAVLGWAPNAATATWDGATLTISTHPLDTSFFEVGKYRSWTDHSNRAIHSAVARIVRRVVPRLRKLAAIARITPSITGDHSDTDRDPND